MIRKDSFGKNAWMKGDWDAVRKDMNLRPIRGIDGLNTDEEFLHSEKVWYNRTGSNFVGNRQAVAKVLGHGVGGKWCSVYIMEHVDGLRIHTHPVPGISVTVISISVREKKSPLPNWRTRLSKKWAIRAKTLTLRNSDGTMRKLTDVSKLHGARDGSKIDIEELYRDVTMVLRRWRCKMMIFVIDRSHDIWKFPVQVSISYWSYVETTKTHVDRLKNLLPFLYSFELFIFTAFNAAS